MADQKVIGLMRYLDNLKALTIRDNDSISTLNNTLRTLEVLHITTELIFRQLSQLEPEIVTQIQDDEFTSCVDVAYPGLSIKIKNYFSHHFNLLACNSEETRVLSECITSLLKRVDDLKADNESLQLECQERQIPKKEPKQETPPTQYETDEEALIAEMAKQGAEEDEEEISFGKIVYECADCLNVMDKVVFTGCRRCGSTNFNTIYPSDRKGR